jgi:hypothetical protein
LKTEDLQAEVTAIDQETAQLKSGADRDIVKKLLNLVERLVAENASLKAEIQTLRDEINRLKGEQGKPDIKANKKKDGDISSEAERKQAEAAALAGTDEPSDNKKKRNRAPKLPGIKIDREEFCLLDKTGLPDDVVLIYYTDVVVQNIIIKTDNVKYRRAVYYSPSQNKYYRGELPDEVRGKGEYGAGIRTLIPVLKTECNMSQKRIKGFFHNFGIKVSAAYVAQQWLGGYELFHQEKSDLYRSGITHSDYIQIDDTSARVNGVNQYCHIVCSPLFTAYFTTPKKDRLTVLGVLTNFAPIKYLYDQQAQNLLNTFNMAKKACIAIDGQLPADVVMDEAEFAAHLASLDGLGTKQKVHLAEACAIAYYQQQTDFPIIGTLLSDDAPQFKLLTLFLALCWIHDGRHYKKLKPVVPTHQSILSDFRCRYWSYYTELLKYQRDPTPEKKTSLGGQFDKLFSTLTDYEELNDRIAKTLAKKAELLQVLDQPCLPLHNNASELGARVQARARDVSFQTRSEAGTKIKDTFMTVNETAKKLGVSFYDYVHDRVTGRFELPSLADLVMQKAQAVRV